MTPGYSLEADNQSDSQWYLIISRYHSAGHTGYLPGDEDWNYRHFTPPVHAADQMRRIWAECPHTIEQNPATPGYNSSLVFADISGEAGLNEAQRAELQRYGISVMSHEDLPEDVKEALTAGMRHTASLREMSRGVPQ